MIFNKKLKNHNSFMDNIKFVFILMVFVISFFIGQASYGQESTSNILPTLQVYVYGVPPYTSNVGGAPSGPIVEKVKQYLKDTGVDYKFISVPWSAAYERARQRPNTLIFPLDRTKTREKEFRWIKPLFNQEYFLYAKNEEGVKDLTLEDIINGNYVVTCGKNTIQCILIREIGIPENKIFEANGLAILQRYSMMVKGSITLTIFEPKVYKAILTRNNLDPNLLKPIFKVGETSAYLGGNLNINPEILEKINIKEIQSRLHN